MEYGPGVRSYYSSHVSILDAAGNIGRHSIDPKLIKLLAKFVTMKRADDTLYVLAVSDTTRLSRISDRLSMLAAITRHAGVLLVAVDQCDGDSLPSAVVWDQLIKEQHADDLADVPLDDEKTIIPFTSVRLTDFIYRRKGENTHQGNQNVIDALDNRLSEYKLLTRKKEKKKMAIHMEIVEHLAKKYPGMRILSPNESFLGEKRGHFVVNFGIEDTEKAEAWIKNRMQRRKIDKANQ